MARGFVISGAIITAITTLVVGLTLVGEGLNDIVNPLLRTQAYQGSVEDNR